MAINFSAIACLPVGVLVLSISPLAATFAEYFQAANPFYDGSGVGLAGDDYYGGDGGPMGQKYVWGLSSLLRAYHFRNFGYEIPETPQNVPLSTHHRDFPSIGFRPGIESNSVSYLSPLNVDPKSISVSGFSSGAVMAQQLFVSHSSLISGCASISGAFYRCGPGNGDGIAFDRACTSLYNPRLNQLYIPGRAADDIHRFARKGLIDDPVLHLKDKRFYVFAGTENYLFNLDLQLGTIPLFEPFIGNPEQIKIKVGVANLTLPNNNNDRNMKSCAGPQGPLFVSNCGFSAAYEVIKWLLGYKMNVKTTKRPIQIHHRLQEFHQSEFFYNVQNNLSLRGPGMDDVGYIFVPKKCLDKMGKAACPLHIYFHGCWTGRRDVGPNHIYQSGYLDVAEANGIVMLFPQATLDPVTQFACWDTYGFASKKDYATKAGVQIKIVKNMIDRLLGHTE